MLSLLLFTVAIFGYANAKFAFPVPSYYAAEKAFRTVQKTIKWDPTNLLTDLAGPLAMCDRLTEWGPAGKKTPVQAETVWNATRIDPVFFPSRDTYTVYYFILTATGADARSVHNDIKASIDAMQRASFQAAPYTEFNTDLQTTIRFGCSVEPQCPTTAGSAAKTVVVCLFLQSNIPPPFYLQGFNETWKAHSHDPYTAVSEATFPAGIEFPGYVYVEDEQIVKQVIGDDLCDKYAYDPTGYQNAVAAYWNNPNRTPTFIHNLAPSKVFGWFLGAVPHVNATNLDFIVSNRDNTIPVQFKNAVLAKMFSKSNPDRNAVLTKNLAVQLNTGACVMAVCPSRYLPRGPSGGKQTTKGNFVVTACMTFFSDEVVTE
jgi:hypothetical protein